MEAGAYGQTGYSTGEQWERLFQTFTREVNPAVRGQVLAALASGSGQRIIAKDWMDDRGDGCIFVEAAMAAVNERWAPERFSAETAIGAIPAALGIDEGLMNNGIHTWDNGSKRSRRRFRRRIAQHLASLAPAAQDAARIAEPAGQTALVRA